MLTYSHKHLKCHKINDTQFGTYASLVIQPTIIG